MCSLGWQLGMQEVLPNCSVLGLECKREENRVVPQKLLFQWDYE